MMVVSSPAHLLPTTDIYADMAGRISSAPLVGVVDGICFITQIDEVSGHQLDVASTTHVHKIKSEII